MATPSSILAWRNPWTEEPGGLQSMGSQSRTRDVYSCDLSKGYLTRSTCWYGKCHSVRLTGSSQDHLTLPGLDYCRHISPTWALDLPSEPITGTHFIFLRHFSYSIRNSQLLLLPIRWQPHSSVLRDILATSQQSVASPFYRPCPLDEEKLLRFPGHTHTALSLPSSGCFSVLNVFPMTFVSTPS